MTKAEFRNLTEKWKMKKMRKKSYLTNDSLNNFNSPEVEITTERNPNFLVYGTKKSNFLVKT